MNIYPRAEIDLAALSHNLNVVRQLTSAKILAIVKANAYGHGLIPIAKTLTEQKPGVDGLGVARLEEAIQLRKNGITGNILLLDGFFAMDELSLIVQHDIDTVVHHEHQLYLLENINPAKQISVWLNIDIGMHHLGFLPEQTAHAYARLMHCNAVKKPLKFMAHFPRAGELCNTITLEQFHLFNTVTKNFAGDRSLARTIAFLNFPETAADWIRPGFILYGCSPYNTLKTLKKNQELNLRPVMTLKSKVIAIKKLKKGNAIGYGGTWTCPQDMQVAIIGIGFGDGYPRNAKIGTPLLIRDKLLPLVGSVSMDKLVVDLRDGPDIEINDEVILWGKGLPIDSLSDYLNAGPAELFCRLSQRVKFIYS